jgi:DNA polymerase sigma
MPYKTGLAEKRKKVLRNELERILPRLIAAGVEKIILFGSLAKNTVGKSSDIDLIVIKKTDKKFLDRLEELYTHIKPETGIDMLVYTSEEFEQMMSDSQFIKSAVKKGRVLYER